LLGFFLFGLILPTAGFWREARRARRYLEGLLQGDGAPPPIR
jgi:hypothetical protein